MQPEIKNQIEQIPVGALDSKIFENDQSAMFNVDRSKSLKVDDLHFFDKNTQIVVSGEKRKVIVGELQQQKKTFMEILAPYLKATGSYTANASYSVYSWIKSGLWWAYQKMANNVVPYAVNQLPKYLFIVSDKKTKKNFTQSQQIIVVGIDDQEYDKIKNDMKKQKVTIIIPIGQKDEQFNQFLKKEGFAENSNMFSLGQSSQQLSQAIMIPYESFQTAYIDLKKEGKDLRKQEKIISKIGDSVAITLSKQYGVLQYPFLDILQEHQRSQTGYIVIPEEIIKKQASKSQSRGSYSGDFPLQKVQQNKIKQKNVEKTQVFEINQQEDHIQNQQNEIGQNYKQQIQVKQSIPIKIQPNKPKIVDNQRKVRVQIPQQTQQNTQKREIYYA